jgi:transposase InsO family protein
MTTTNVQVECANGTIITAKWKGDLKLATEDDQGQSKTIIVRDAIYTPDASGTLLSLGQLSENGIDLHTKGNSMTLERGGKLYARGIRTKGRIWVLKQLNYMPRAMSAREVVLKASIRTRQELLHARLGHPGNGMSSKYKLMLDGLDGKVKHCFCESCVQSKITRKPSKKPMTEVSKKLGRLHMDLCGPFPALSLQGMKIMLTVTDQESRYLGVRFTSKKSDVLDLIKEVKEQWENDRKIYGDGELLQCIHVDRGTEFINKKTKDWCESHNIKLEATVGYLPEANGIAERCNRFILERANAMRIEAGLGPEYWEFACETAVYLRNRGPIKNKLKTPWEDWHNEKPSIAHYKVFGCPAWVHIPKIKRDKIKTKAWKGIFIGYREDTVTTYKIWDPVKQLVYEARFVLFDERHTEKSFEQLEVEQEENGGAESYDGSSDDDEDNSDSDNNRPTRNGGGIHTVDVIPSVISPLRLQSPQLQPPSRTGTADENTIIVAREEDEETIVVDDGSQQLAEPATTAKQRKTKADARRLAKNQKDQADRQARKQQEEERGDRRSVRHKANLALQTISQDIKYIPKSYADATTCAEKDKWIAAIESELSSIIERNTFSEPIELEHSEQTINAKFVFDLKTGEDGEILKYKARLVARGDLQKHGINYEETFAPTLRYDALRAFLAIAARNGWKVHQMDVVTAYLAGHLEEKIILRVPEYLQYRFGKYVRILKSIYGLKQAARVWHLLLEEFLQSIGFTPLPTDPSILTNGKTYVSIGVYVDDLLIMGESEVEIRRAKEQLSKRFQMKDLGLARNVLGMRIQRVDSLLTIDQSTYAAEIVKEFLYNDSIVHNTPMDSNAVMTLVTDPGKPLTEEEHTAYLRALGKLMFLCNTRPDITFAVHKLGQFSAQPAINHWKAILRVIGYVFTTLQYGLVYGAANEGLKDYTEFDYYTLHRGVEGHAGTSKAEDIMAFTDADHAGDPSDRKSVMGFVFMIFGGPIAWWSVKEKSVTRATTTAEYIALSEGTHMALWLRKLISSIEGSKESAHAAVPLVFGDNRASIQLSSGLSNTSKIKHVDTAFHHIVDEVKKKNIKLQWVPGKNMLADGFTKPLPLAGFREWRDKLGMQDVMEMMRLKGKF